MLSGGDWVIPHLNGLAYVEKPPLQYWATALSLQLVGQSEFGARLYTALCALAAVLSVALTANRLWGAAAGWRARRTTGKHALVSRHGTAADAGHEPDLVHDAGARGISAGAARRRIRGTGGRVAARHGGAGRGDARRGDARRGDARHEARARVDAPRLDRDGARGAHQGAGGGGSSGRRARPVQPVCSRLVAVAAAACLDRSAVVLGDRDSLVLARGAAPARFPPVLLRARAFCALPHAERRSRGGVVVLRRGLSAGQHAVDASGAAGPVSGLAPAEPRRRIQPKVVSAHLGAVRVPFLLDVELQAHSLHPARVSGARVAHGRSAEGCLRARSGAHRALDPRLRDRARGNLSVRAAIRRTVRPKRVFLGAREAFCADCAAPGCIGPVRDVATPPRSHARDGLPGRRLVLVRVAGDAGRGGGRTGVFGSDAGSGAAGRAAGHTGLQLWRPTIRRCPFIGGARSSSSPIEGSSTTGCGTIRKPSCRASRNSRRAGVRHRAPMR